MEPIRRLRFASSHRIICSAAHGSKRPMTRLAIAALAAMVAAALTDNIEIESDSLLQTLVDQMQFSKAVERWSRCINALNRWEESHLLVDNPAAEHLTKHK